MQTGCASEQMDPFLPVYEELAKDRCRPLFRLSTSAFPWQPHYPSVVCLPLITISTSQMPSLTPLAPMLVPGADFF